MLNLFAHENFKNIHDMRPFFFTIFHGGCCFSVLNLTAKTGHKIENPQIYLDIQLCLYVITSTNNTQRIN